MRSKRKELFTKLSAGLAITLRSVGETKRSWNSRGSEHKLGTGNNRESAIKDHAETTDHDISINHIEILEIVRQLRAKKFDLVLIRGDQI